MSAVFGVSSDEYLYSAPVAKRSVKRAREQGRAPKADPRATASSAPRPQASPGRRQFWLGALAAAALLIPCALLAIVLVGGDRPGTPGGGAAPTASPQSEVQRLQELTHTRDKEQVKDLTDRMRGYAQQLDPVLTGVAKTLPPEEKDKVGPLAAAGEVEDWRKRTRTAAADFDDIPSGDTGTNVARGALATAVRGLAEMMESYKLALDTPAARTAMLERVRAQRDLAMKAWQTAAVQIDVVNIAAGFGHQHPPAPGSGVAPPDNLPEGTDATNGG